MEEGGWDVVVGKVVLAVVHGGWIFGERGTC